MIPPFQVETKFVSARTRNRI